MCFCRTTLNSMLQFMEEETPNEILARCQNQIQDQGQTETRGSLQQTTENILLMNRYFFFLYLLKMYLAGEGGFLLNTLCTETDPLTKSFLLAKAAFLVFSSSSACNFKKKKKNQTAFWETN